MSCRILIFLLALVLVPNALAQLQLNAFVSVSSANPCDANPLDPNLPIDVGSAPVGASGFSATVCVFNTGSTAITITSINVTGTDFSEGPDPIPFTLQPNKGNFETIQIKFSASAAGTRTGQVTLVDSAANSPQTFQIVGTGFTDFGISLHDPGAGTQTTLASGAPLYHLSVLGASGFSGTINISCSGLPTGASCKPSSSSFTTSGSTVGDLFLQVITTGPPIAHFFNPYHAWFTLAVVAGLVIAGAQRKKRNLVFLITAAVISCFLISCGGSSKSTPSGPTPPGTYTFSVTGTSNGVSHSRNLTLIVK